MRRKYLAFVMGVVIAVAPVSALAEEGSTEAVAMEAPDTGADFDEEKIQGEVTEVGTDFITIAQRAMGNMGGGMGEAPEAGEEAGAAPEAVDDAGGTEDAEAEAPSDDMADGETITIAVTEDTVIQRQSGMGGEMGEAPSDMGGEGAPEKPDGDGGEMGEAPSDMGGEGAPEKPDGDGGEMGEAPSDMGGEDVPEKPDGDGGGEMGEAPAGEERGMEAEEITLKDIEVGDTVMITLNDDGTAATVTVQSDMGGGMSGGMDGQSSGVDSYDSIVTYEEDTTVDGETVASTGADENAILVDGDATVTLSDMTITKESSESTGGDNSSFYGVGAAVLGTDGTTIISDSTISTDSEGGAGVFAYGDGVVCVMDTDITTALNTSGGIHAAGGGTLYAWDVTAETNGTSSAAVRSDRGGGTMVIDGGTYISNGSDSPAVYCTADICIEDAALTANGAEAVCIEGLNTLRLYDCDLTGSMPDDERNENTWTVIVYQSMSGDSEVGNGTFQMVGGTLTSNNGGLFYTTNTECTITLENVEIVFSEDCGFFLQCTGNINSRGWGTAGANGSDCLFTAISQSMDGDVVWDSISALDFYMTEGSTLTGAIVDDESYAGDGGQGYCNVILDNTSTWIVTGDSTVTALQNGGNILDADGNAVTVVGADGTVYVVGDSAYTVTVGSYTEDADMSGASATDAWEDHAVERPEV